MEAEQFISAATTELEMVEAQLRDIEARAVALRARGDGLRFLIQYGLEAQAGVRIAGTTPSSIGARRAERATGKIGLPWRATLRPAGTRRVTVVSELYCRLDGEAACRTDSFRLGLWPCRSHSAPISPNPPW